MISVSRTNTSISCGDIISVTIGRPVFSLASLNDQIILCERGIRTFETYTRNTLDLGAVLAVKKLSHVITVSSG